ncbi:PspC domain-containing protein [Sphingomicrobium nitratireducens]|uniref:PspC domain-containing protein n=1 Tax=Sphingomicrobium nitratireducens TaxID=2964666 RepID=UPI002240C659|nr:PspC domain-containing protein [Sphingomicrobium nitratireducens]
MAKDYRYSLARADKKLAGVCARMGDQFGIDPTFIRVAFAATFLFIKWEAALIAYVAMGIYYSIQRKREVDAGRGAYESDFEKMARIGKRRGSTHDLRTKLDDADRRMMAIDHHLNSADSDELAREIEKLREEK